MQLVKIASIIIAVLTFARSSRLGYSFLRSTLGGQNGVQRALLFVFAGLLGKSLLAMAFVYSTTRPAALVLHTVNNALVAIGLDLLEREL